MTAGNLSDHPTFSHSVVPALSPSPQPDDADNSRLDNDSSSEEPRLSHELSASTGRWLKRLVSQEEISVVDTESVKSNVQYISGEEDFEPGESIEKTERLNSPLRCVSEFDKAALLFSSAKIQVDDTASRVNNENPPPLPNPLYNVNIRKAHIRAVRLEAELFPMRQILSRLMSHLTHNRKGLFNTPVDPVALRLPDYYTIVTNPMDLGTVKTKLHSMHYQSREQVCHDIRLVFCNAMKYNPPSNPVHIAARELLAFFEKDCQGLGPAQGTDQISEDQKKQKLDSNTLNGAHGQQTFTVKIKTNEVIPHSTLSPLLDHSEKLSMTRTVSREPELLLASRDAFANKATSSKSQAGRIPSHTVLESLHIRKKPLVATPEFFSPKSITRKRKLRFAAGRMSFHSCQFCRGRVCVICEQGCLPLEPILLICNGSNCAGARIRKGAMYYIAQDGSCQYCQKCYTGLAAVLPDSKNSERQVVRYKRDLLKRKNEEEVVECWLTCTVCKKGVHRMCAMHNEYVHSEENYVCPLCHTPDSESSSSCLSGSTACLPVETTMSDGCKDSKAMYTFVSGSDFPVPLAQVVGSNPGAGSGILGADGLRETAVSSFIERKVRELISAESNVANAEKTVTVRIISECTRLFNVPDVVRKHFRMPTSHELQGSKSWLSAEKAIAPPKKVKYQSKAIALFQKIDGLDVCIFCMYVHEYDGEEEYDSHQDLAAVASHKKRVYIAYLDSVEHFQPRRCRTAVYHEILVSYLATARIRGYETVQIWACPPSRGNSFVFWNHPASQRTPSSDRLETWYHGALSRAVECGVVTDVKSLYESDFQPQLEQIEKESEVKGEAVKSCGKLVCPPLLDGDFWIEEAVRVHNTNFTRLQKTTPSACDEVRDRCPARQVASLLRDRIIANQSAAAFRRPVNAAALKLKDYHTIITKPMDLGTIYSQCALGEYSCLRELVEDVKLVFSNARRYNPIGHFVHMKAIEMELFFFEELNYLVSRWREGFVDVAQPSWEAFAEMSLRLDKFLHEPYEEMKSVCSSPKAIQHNVSSCGQSDSKSIAPDQASCPTEEAKDNSFQSLLTLGPEAVRQRMAGNDVWLLDKKNPTPPKGLNMSKKSAGRRKRNASEADEDSLRKCRRQTWVGEEVGSSVRKMRTSFFRCSLLPNVSMSELEHDKLRFFSSYSASFASNLGADYTSNATESRVADARHAFLEFSQFRNLEFDTLRHAKYSTSILLYHLRNQKAPGRVPTCTSCKREIDEVRWHKVKKVAERRRVKKGGSTTFTNVVFEAAEELCLPCHAKHPRGEEFIPVQVSCRA